MKIERLIEKGLLLGGSGKVDVDGIASRDRESMHMHGEVLRSSAEPETEDEHEHEQEVETPRASVIQEFKRQSGVFFDDFEEGEDTGVSEDDAAVAPPPLVDGHDKVD